MNEMNNGLSLRKAAYNNGINYQTLHNRINSKHTKCNGRLAKLEENIESFLVEILAAESECFT
jgi:lambda repressor-like predicted transcriptional regulator